MLQQRLGAAKKKKKIQLKIIGQPVATLVLSLRSIQPKKKKTGNIACLIFNTMNLICKDGPSKIMGFTQK